MSYDRSDAIIDCVYEYGTWRDLSDLIASRGYHIKADVETREDYETSCFWDLYDDKGNVIGSDYLSFDYNPRASVLISCFDNIDRDKKNQIDKNGRYSHMI